MDEERTAEQCYQELAEYLEGKGFEFERDGETITLQVEGENDGGYVLFLTFPQSLYEVLHSALFFTFVETPYGNGRCSDGIDICNTINKGFPSLKAVFHNDDGEIRFELPVQVGYPGWEEVAFSLLLAFMEDVDKVYGIILNDAGEEKTPLTIAEKCKIIAKTLEQNNLKYAIVDETTVGFEESARNYSDQDFLIMFHEKEDEDGVTQTVEVSTTITADFTGEKELSGLRLCNRINNSSTGIRASLEESGDIFIERWAKIDGDSWYDIVLDAIYNCRAGTNIACALFAKAALDC